MYVNDGEISSLHHPGVWTSMLPALAKQPTKSDTGLFGHPFPSRYGTNSSMCAGDKGIENFIAVLETP